MVLFSAVSPHVRDNILRWKFNNYDSNGDATIRLENTEENRFHKDISDFAGCTHYLFHISDLIDEDNNNSITSEEWHRFFIVDHTLGKPTSSCLMQQETTH